MKGGNHERTLSFFKCVFHIGGGGVNMLFISAGFCAGSP